MSSRQDFTLGTISPNEGYILSKLARLEDGVKPYRGYDCWIEQLRPNLQLIAKKIVGIERIDKLIQSKDDYISVQILKCHNMQEKLKKYVSIDM